VKKLALVVLLLFVVSTSAQGTGHWIDEVAGGGAIVILEDHSVWGIDAVDRANSLIWLTADEITVERTNENPAYPYVLVDKREDKTVHAKYMGKP
jgi:hypothetical protein